MMTFFKRDVPRASWCSLPRPRRKPSTPIVPPRCVRSTGEIFMHVAGGSNGIPRLLGRGRARGRSPAKPTRRRSPPRPTSRGAQGFLRSHGTGLHGPERCRPRQAGRVLRHQVHGARRTTCCCSPHVHEHLGQSIAYARVERDRAALDQQRRRPRQRPRRRPSGTAGSARPAKRAQEASDRPRRLVAMPGGGAADACQSAARRGSRRARTRGGLAPSPRHRLPHRWNPGCPAPGDDRARAGRAARSQAITACGSTWGACASSAASASMVGIATSTRSSAAPDDAEAHLALGSAWTWEWLSSFEARPSCAPEQSLVRAAKLDPGRRRELGAALGARALARPSRSRGPCRARRHCGRPRGVGADGGARLRRLAPW